MAKKRQTTKKTELIKLIQAADYLNEAQKDEWINICDDLTEKQLKDTYKEFKKMQSDVDDFKLKLVFKAGLGNEYKAKIKEISAKYKTKARKKTEQNAAATEEKPEDILSKLNEI